MDVAVREDREVAAPPAKALAALATAAENLGFRVRDVRAQPGILIVTTGLSLKGGSLGFILTARARRFNRGSRLSLDATPLLGPWARSSADAVLDRWIQELQLVLDAPKGRIRRPSRSHPGSPFGKTPQLLGLAWAAVGVLVFGLMLSGWWWTAAGFSLLGALLLLVPQATPWWSQLVIGLGVLSLPAGLLGLIARKQARTNALWSETVEAFHR